jgi:hypothetical protein
MDNSRVTKLNVPPQAYTPVAQPPRANQLASDRFSRAMGDSPTVAPSSNERGTARGTPISDLTREAPQENREHAYRRLQGALGSGVMGAVAKDLSTGSADDRNPTQVASSASVWSQFAVATQPRAMSAPPRASGAELPQMLERMCSALYVGDKSVGTQRVVMALDHVLPGAAAEIVREGVHLSVRLHARTEEAYRSMASQRDALIRALNGDGESRVDVSVVHGDEKSLGDGHG